MWGSAYGGSNRINGDPLVGSTNIITNAFGFAAGMDYHFTPYTIAGFALAGGGTNWGLANAMGTGRSDALQVGLYGINWFGPAYLAGALAFSNHWFSTNRSALGDHIDGEFYWAELRRPRRRRLSFWRSADIRCHALRRRAGAIFPYAGLQRERHERRRLRPQLQRHERRRRAHRLGSRFDAPTLLYGKPLVLYGRVAWAHDFVSTRC